MPALMAFALAAVPPTSAAEASVQAAVQVVRAYYAAVSRRDYRAAYRLWHGGQSYARFRQGYAQTVRVTVTPIPPFDAKGAAGSIYAEISVKVEAVLRSGAHQHFAGSYTLRRVNDVEGSTAAQRRWHVESAHLRPVDVGK